MAAPPTSDATHHDVLRDFIASWDEELHHEDAPPQAAADTGSGALVAYESPQQACMQSHSDTQSHGAARTSHSSSSENDADAMSAAFARSTAPPPVVVRKRKRRMFEIRQLREEAKALEQHHRKLHEHLLKQITGPEHHLHQRLDGDAHTVSSGGCAPLVVAVAHYELELLHAAELKNHELRAEHQRQRQVAMQLQRLLMKTDVAVTNTQRHFGSVLYLLQQQLQFVPNPQQVLGESHYDFQRLLRQIDPMQQELAHIQRLVKGREQLRQQASAHHSHMFRDWQVREDPTNGLYVDLVDSYEAPFNRFEMNAALRLHYGEHQGSSNVQSKHICEYFLSTGDTFIRQSVPVFTDKSHQGQPAFRLKEVVRNFSDDTQSVFLVVVLIQPVNPATGEPFKAMTLRERKWTVIKSDGARACIVQTYHLITREWVDAGDEGLWTRKMLKEAMVPTWIATLSSIQSHVEAILMEQSIMMRNGFSNSKRLGSELTG